MKAQKTWIYIVIALSMLCFASIFFIARSNSIVFPETKMTMPPVKSTITWYTATTLDHAQRLANAFTTKTGLGWKS